MVTIVILAMVALFLGLRLYSVLGKRTGHEPVLPNPADERVPAPITLPRSADSVPETRDLAPRNIDTGAQQGLRALIVSDPNFDTTTFIEGAKSAYRMILESFWKGDEETLSWLTEDNVRAAFAESIRERAEAGHVLDNRLVSIERARIVEASVEARVARVTVAFDAVIAAVTRDGEGNVIAGSLTDAVETNDVWTFARAVKSSDPNWKLADTD